MPLDDAYWSGRYSNDTAGWDAGTITAPLKKYLDQLTDKNVAILIPGCGNGYEAEYLLQKNFSNITLIDISSVLCRNLEEKLQPFLSSGLKIICADFFELQGQYDLIIEQTFFCALDPSLRKAYADKMYHLLKPGGKLVGLLFNRFFQGAPPFGGDENEYRELFQQQFNIAVMEECYNSIAPRKGAELFVKLIKSGAPFVDKMF
jgi:methyl halide transferase